MTLAASNHRSTAFGVDNASTLVQAAFLNPLEAVSLCKGIAQLLCESRPIFRQSNRLNSLLLKLFLCVAEAVAERFVRSEESSFGRDDNHTNSCVTENAAELFFALAQRFLRPLALGDIHIDAEHS